MADPKYAGAEPPKGSTTAVYPAILLVISVVALSATYLLANSGYDLTTMVRGFSAIIVSFLIVCISLHIWYSRRGSRPREMSTDLGACRQLQALEDANEFFAGSLRTTDCFRLVASRVREMLPFRTITLYLFDEQRIRLRAAESLGMDAEHRRGRFSEASDRTVGKAYISQMAGIHPGAESSLPAAAIPLKHGNQIFGVLHLDFEMTFRVEDLDLDLVDAIGNRAAPLVFSSISYEHSRANALTDTTTDLPNERAFFMVLENHVAESQRKSSTRPLSILALDVRSFDEINRQFGHAVGDRVLGFVARLVRENLRQMDFLARSSADEFIVALPTASREIAHDIMARIQTGFFERKFKVNENDSVEIELNIGWAAFGTDGETPETLLRIARERKGQSKTSTPSTVLWFPTEFAS